MAVVGLNGHFEGEREERVKRGRPIPGPGEGLYQRFLGAQNNFLKRNFWKLALKTPKTNSLKPKMANNGPKLSEMF